MEGVWIVHDASATREKWRVARASERERERLRQRQLRFIKNKEQLGQLSTLRYHLKAFTFAKFGPST